MKRKAGFIFAMVLLLSSLAACGGTKDSVVGTWVVKEYSLDGETVTKDEIQDYLGENAAHNNDYKLIFTSSGNLEITSPNFATGGTNTAKAAYTVQDGSIEVYEPDDPTDFELLEYDGANILIDMRGFSIVMEKQ